MTSEACTNVTTSKLHDTQCGCLLVPGRDPNHNLDPKTNPTP